MQTKSETPAESGWKTEEKDLMQSFLHWMLLIGISISTFLLLSGLILAIFTGQQVPAEVPAFDQIIPDLLAYRPIGLLTLGILVLIATPILRVFGSVLAFVYERDWRYAGITFIVFLIVILSIFLG